MIPYYYLRTIASGGSGGPITLVAQLQAAVSTATAGVEVSDLGIGAEVQAAQISATVATLDVVTIVDTIGIDAQ